MSTISTLDRLLPTKPLRAAVPGFEPITTAEAKKHLEIPSAQTTHDTAIGTLISIAREQIEHDTGFVLATGSFTWNLTSWPSESWLELPLRPVSSITSIKYYDPAGTQQTWSSAGYGLDNERPKPIVYLKYGQEWPTDFRGHTNDILVTFAAGYSAANVVPYVFKQMALLLVARAFEDREGLERGEQDLQAYVRAYEMLVRRMQRSGYP